MQKERYKLIWILSLHIQQTQIHTYTKDSEKQKQTCLIMQSARENMTNYMLKLIYLLGQTVCAENFATMFTVLLPLPAKTGFARVALGDVVFMLPTNLKQFRRIFVIVFQFPNISQFFDCLRKALRYKLPCSIGLHFIISFYSYYLCYASICYSSRSL